MGATIAALAAARRPDLVAALLAQVRLGLPAKT